MRYVRRGQGFSLLEMLVALAILALSLGALYQATSGATRNARSAEKYAYGVELARSLVAEYAQVPASGLSTQGETAGGFLWRVQARPAQAGSGSLPPGAVQDIEVAVSWTDGPKARRVLLNSVVAGVDRQ
ncbi:MAG: general secretion pathway protein GspI [Haliea sp.]|mgnify:CR=1 FL=1|uniref:type IV pilus modification PilV family protein n=1 Tax=Haliea sp. TaxID=1932666 RepID=UPI000C5F32C0|nr:prepilin-type N-terminal cleavage/methylation domain-containing protein [Haliea sp.]MBM69877.1 general secretion pathway protein GspI [Haliea sp.]